MDISNPFGFVAGRWAFATADTAGDPDRAPDYIPASGASITFTPETPRQVVPDSPGWTGVINKRVVGKLNEDGRLVDAEGHNHFALGVGTYAVHYYFGNGIKWPSHRIQVTEAHTASNPLWLPPMPAPPDVPGAVNRTIQVPADGTDGQVLVWDGGTFSWVFPPRGPEGPAGEVTTPQLTTALAGKVTGTGMTLRHDTTVGERVLLDHPGGTTMLYGDTGWRDMASYLPPGVPGTFLARRTLHATDIQLNVTLTADWQYIGANSRAVTDLIRDLPRSMFPTSATGVPTSLFMRDGTVGGPTGGVTITHQGSGVTRMRITTTNWGNWEAGTTIRISGTIPNDQPWPTSQYGQPGTP